MWNTFLNYEKTKYLGNNPAIISYSSVSSIKRNQTTMSTTVLEELHKIIANLRIWDNNLF